MGTVVFDNVTKMYGDTVGIQGLSLEIKEEEFFVLVGPSGAGKTTTLKTVAGLLTPSEGRLYIDGKLSNLLKPDERNVSMTFESYALYPHFTVYENIANPLRSPKFGIPVDKIDAEVRRISRLLEIDHLLDRRPGELSGGQKQRVSLGRAMVRRPSVFLLDEPLSHVDAKVRHRMRVELNHLQRELNTTTIYVTHDYVEGLSLGDRVGVINNGQLVQVDTPRTIYHSPINEFVGQHVGFPEMDIVGADVVNGQGKNLQLAVDNVPSMRLSVSKEQRELLRAKSNGRIRVGFRPQSVQIVPEREAQFKGTVYAFNPFVTYGVLILEVEGTQFNLLTEAYKHFEVGETLACRIAPEDLYLFDEQSSINLTYLE